MGITSEEQMDMCDFKCETLKGHNITYVVLRLRMYKPNLAMRKHQSSPK